MTYFAGHRCRLKLKVTHHWPQSTNRKTRINILSEPQISYGLYRYISNDPCFRYISVNVHDIGLKVLRHFWRPYRSGFITSGLGLAYKYKSIIRDERLAVLNTTQISRCCSLALQFIAILYSNLIHQQISWIFVRDSSACRSDDLILTSSTAWRSFLTM